MLNQTSQEFRALFLLAFTKKLIENSKTEEVFKLEKILKEKQKEKQKIIKEKLTSKKETKPLQKFPEKKPLKIQKTNMILRIPQPRIPPHLRYLQPFATQEIINIETINPLLKDRRVKIIECQGPDEKIIVQGEMGRKPTKIKLTEEDINEIIQAFSQASKIPIQKGVFKVVLGNLILSAIISEEIGTKFIIKKISRQRIF